MATEEEIAYFREKLNFGEDGRDLKLGDMIDTVRDTYEFNYKKFKNFFYKRFPTPELDDFIINYLGLFRYNFSYDVLKYWRILAYEHEDWMNSPDYIEFRDMPEYQEPPFNGDLKTEVEIARDLIFLPFDEAFGKYNVDLTDMRQVYLFTQACEHYRYLIYLSSTLLDNNIYRVNYRPFHENYMFIDYKAKFGARIRPDTMQHMESAMWRQRREYSGKLYEKHLFTED